MPQRIQVRQEEMVVLPLRSHKMALMTKGVSTCVCLMARGHVGEMPFLAMYHWDGFGPPFDKAAPNAREQAVHGVEYVFSFLAEAIMKKMKPYRVKRGEIPQLDALYLVGGEHATLDLSGTELEVETLREHTERLCARYFALSPHTTYVHDYYRTHGSEALNVLFTSDDIKIEFDSVDDSDFESDTSSDLNDDSPRPCF